ncbi:putative aldo-keto reductase 6 [Quercus suber]|uniref:Aldo-keto reductase 6 n=1 Tax=Quercus suber TaxID=58331 RepID=A0AAW0IHA9_QUESU
MHPITISTSLRSSPREDVCPIPGTTKIVNFNQNIGVVSMKLTTKEMVEFESFFSEDLIMDDRYMHDLIQVRKDAGKNVINVFVIPYPPPLPKHKGSNYNPKANSKSQFCT